MIKGISSPASGGWSRDDIERAIIGAAHRHAADAANSTLVDSSTLGYREGMRHEVRPAPAWRMPISEFVRYLQARRLSDGTVKLRSYHLRVLSNAFRNRSPYSLVEADLNEFLAILGRHTGRNTTRSYQMSYRMFFKHALQHGLIQSNPLEFVEPIKMIKGRPRPADIDAIRTAIDNASPRARLMIQLGVSTGMRRAEIAAVHTRDVVVRSNGYALNVPKGKGEKPRTIPISALLAERIRDLPEGWVFPSQKGIDNHILPGRVGEIMGEVLQPLGVTPHMLRHRFATSAYAAKGNLIAVSELLGHASIATTQIYTETPDDELRIAANAAASIFM